MVEVWKSIDGTGGRYEVSNTGKVRSLNYMAHGKPGMLKPLETKDGYYKVRIYYPCGYKGEFVHRLVAKAFLPSNGEGLQVNHIDGNKKNNRIENLEFCTAKENVRHSYKIGLRDDQLRKQSETLKGKPIARFQKHVEESKMKIKATNIETGEVLFFESQAQAAQKLNAHQPSIYRVVHGVKKSHHGYKFEMCREGEAHVK